MKKFQFITGLIFCITSFYCSSQVIHVPADQPTIQAGIDAASSGDTVLVTDGLYLENINFMGKAITVASHYIIDKDYSHIENTIIDGSQPVNPDVGAVVTFDSGEDTTSILKGLTITGGSGNYYPDYNVRAGGGIAFSNSGGKICFNIIMGDTIISTAGIQASGGGISAGPPNSGYTIVISNNKIMYNYIESDDMRAFGGGIDSRVSAIIKSNEIFDNVAHSLNERAVGGGLFMNGSYLDLTENLLHSNDATSSTVNAWGGAAGGLFVGRSTGVIQHNIIEDNEVSSIQFSQGGGVMLEGVDTNLIFSHNIVRNNQITTGTGRFGGGIYLHDGDREGNGKIYYNQINSNYSERGGGVYLRDINSSHFHFIGNTITDNVATSNGGGVFMATNDPFDISNSIIWGNSAGWNPDVADPYNCISITYSDIGGVVAGIGNINADPEFDTVTYRLTESSPCIDTGDPSTPEDPDETRADMGCYPFFQGTRINVKQDGTGHFMTIQEAIDVATPADTIMVYQGTYFENINFHGKAILLASRHLVEPDDIFITNTVIDGSLSKSMETGAVVTFKSGEDTTSVIHGFTITGGTGNYYPASPDLPPMFNGGGIDCAFSVPKIEHNIIRNNSLRYYNGAASGGGISFGPPIPGAEIIIENNEISENYVDCFYQPTGGGIFAFGNCRIKYNNIQDNTCFCALNQSAGGGIVCQMGAVNIVGNTITGNEAISVQKGLLSNWGGFGGGMALVLSYGNVSGNEIRGNKVFSADADSSTSAGLLIEMCGDSLVFDCNVVAENLCNGGESFGGGLGIFYGEATLTNNFLFENQAKYGGGIAIIDTLTRMNNITIINNTITGNIADSRGGAMYVELFPDFIPADMHDTVNMMNNILWGDAAQDSQEIHLVRGIMNVVYSDIDGGWDGEGNIDLDPEFDPEDDSLFHISGGSPCMEAGHEMYAFGNGVCYCPVLDFDGQPRPSPYFPGVDIGADEYFLNSGTEDPLVSGPLVTVSPNPFSDNTIFSFTPDQPEHVQLIIYDTQGQVVSILFNGTARTGEQKVTFNARNLSPGIYYYRFSAGRNSSGGRIILLR